MKSNLGFMLENFISYRSSEVCKAVGDEFDDDYLLAAF